MKYCLALLIVLCLTSVWRPQAIIKTPREAAQGLFHAWSKNRRKTAQNYAQAEAIKKLFGVRKQHMIFKGCAKLEKGDYECLYENRRLDLSMAMIVKIYRAGYRVTSVSFSSEGI